MAINTIHARNKEALAPLRAALTEYEQERVWSELTHVFKPNALVQLATPFNDLDGVSGLYREAYEPLYRAIPDLERRDTIVLAGSTAQAHNWVGCCGYYTGTFVLPWLDIAPTGHQVSMRFHEFFRFEDGQVVEMQALWDIPEVMIQARAWPMVPSLGREWHVPGPANQCGLVQLSGHELHTSKSLSLVNNMIDALGQHSVGGVAAMELDKYWHPRCNWYGPSGIGTGRGIAGFRNWHQIPFLNGMPDRRGSNAKTQLHLFAEGDFVAFTAWPGMEMSISGDGFLGIAPSNQKIVMRSLDFWRCENGLIRENWVLVDLLHVYQQIGVDVFARLREFNKARVPYQLS